MRDPSTLFASPVPAKVLTSPAATATTFGPRSSAKLTISSDQSNSVAEVIARVDAVIAIHRNAHDAIEPGCISFAIDEPFLFGTAGQQRCFAVCNEYSLPHCRDTEPLPQASDR